MGSEEVMKLVEYLGQGRLFYIKYYSELRLTYKFTRIQIKITRQVSIDHNHNHHQFNEFIVHVLIRAPGEHFVNSCVKRRR